MVIAPVERGFTRLRLSASIALGFCRLMRLSGPRAAGALLFFPLHDISSRSYDFSSCVNAQTQIAPRLSALQAFASFGERFLRAFSEDYSTLPSLEVKPVFTCSFDSRILCNGPSDRIFLPTTHTK